MDTRLGLVSTWQLSIASPGFRGSSSLGDVFALCFWRSCANGAPAETAGMAGRIIRHIYGNSDGCKSARFS